MIQGNFVENGNDSYGENNAKASYKCAVCSTNNLNVDLHFGHADKFHIYEYCDGIVNFIESRPVNQYCNGKDKDENHDEVITSVDLIKDCKCLICMKIGYYPSKILEENLINIYITYDKIENAVKSVAESLGW